MFLGNELQTVKEGNETRISQKVLQEPYIGHSKKQETMIAYD
jgi:hypothetical protein